MNEDRDKCMKALTDYLDATIAFRETIQLLSTEDPAQGLMIANLMNEMNKTVPQMLSTYVRLVLFGKEQAMCILAQNVLNQYRDTAKDSLEMARSIRGITPS